MFFHHDYSTPGPGIDPDAPEKTGIARFVEILQLECGTLLKLNLLFLLCCVPVVTIPPAVYAMTCVIRRMVRDEVVLLGHHYFTAFRKGFFRSYASFFLVAFPLIASGFGGFFYLMRAGGNFLFFVPFMFCSTIFLVTLLASNYFYGLFTSGWSLKESLRLGLLLGLGKPLRGALAAIFLYGSLIICILEFPLSTIFLLFIGFSVPCLIAHFYTRTVLIVYCPVEEEEEIYPDPVEGEEDETRDE